MQTKLQCGNPTAVHKSLYSQCLQTLNSQSPPPSNHPNYFSRSPTNLGLGLGSLRCKGNCNATTTAMQQLTVFSSSPNFQFTLKPSLKPRLCFACLSVLVDLMLGLKGMHGSGEYYRFTENEMPLLRMFVCARGLNTWLKRYTWLSRVLSFYRKRYASASHVFLCSWT